MLFPIKRNAILQSTLKLVKFNDQLEWKQLRSENFHDFFLGQYNVVGSEYDQSHAWLVCYNQNAPKDIRKMLLI